MEVNEPMPTGKSNLVEFIEEIRQENTGVKRKLDAHFTDLNSSMNENCQINLTMKNEDIHQLVTRLLEVFSGEKSPVQVLKEIFPNPYDEKFKMIDQGSYGQCHDPLHFTAIEIKEIGTFYGKAKSKQESRQKAARIALEFISNLLKEPFIPEKAKRKNKKRKTNEEFQQQQQQEISYQSSFIPTEIIPYKNDNCISMQTDTQRVTESPSSTENQIKEIIMRIMPKEEIDDINYMLKQGFTNRICKPLATKFMELFNPTNIGNIIEKTIDDTKAIDLFKSHDLWRYKEIAAFILVSDLDQSIKILSIGAGTKSLTGSKLSLYGDVVHDCHAEIIARRSLLLVFYEHIEALIKNNFIDKPEFILEKGVNGKFCLKKHLKIYLYISSPPCGDARVFTLNEKQKRNQSYSQQGVLRCKIDHGQGTVPMPLNYISTWDGILIGTQRLILMSCSDKIALWNVVGVQGSLLSLLMEPIYIEGLIVSQLFHYDHLKRAIHARIDKQIIEQKLPSNGSYRLNRCKFGVYSDLGIGNVSHANPNFPSFSQNWYCSGLPDNKNNNNCENIEILRAETGTNYFNDNVSRLSKKKLLDKFVKLVNTHPDICPNIFNEINNKNESYIDKKIHYKTYRDLKNYANEYLQAKISLYKTFMETDLRTWVKAPLEVDLFAIQD